MKLIYYIICLVLFCVAIGTSFWSVLHVDTTLSEDIRFKYDYNLGLWNGCINNKLCTSVPDKTWTEFPNDSFLACRWLSVVSAVLVFIGVIMLKQSKRSAMLLLLAGVCGLVVSILWYVKFKKLKFYSGQEAVDAELGYSFICNLVGAILAVLSGFFLMSK